MDKNVSERIKSNQKLLELLKETLCMNPELRFIQALFVTGIIDQRPNNSEIIDRFYEEPSETLKRITLL